MRLGRIAAIAYKEVLHVRRDPRTLVFALVVPVGLILLFGYAISFDVDNLPLGVVDQARTQASRRFVDELTASHELVAVARGESLDDVMEEMRRGELVAIVVVPRDYGESDPLVCAELSAMGTTGGYPCTSTAQLLVDGTDGLIASRVIGIADVTAALMHLTELRAQGLGVGPPTRLSLVSAFNPAGLSAWFIVPGLAAYVVAIVAVLLTSLTIAGEIERGSMEQLFATPVSRLEIVLGKLLPYLGLGGLAVALVLGVGVVVFSVPVRGDAFTLVLSSLLFLAGMLGQGLLISTVARTQMVATQVAVMSSMLPSMLLSGFVFPIENMPTILQLITHVVPARYYVEALRGILLRGNGFETLWSQQVALGVFAFVVLTLATVRFRREVA